MDEKEYNKLLKEIDTEQKRIDDSLTDEDQKAYSRKRLEELNKKKESYVPKTEGEGAKEKSYLEKAMEGTSNNIANASAAYTPDLGSSKDASLAGNPEFVEADKKRDEAKMNGTATDVAEAEADVQALLKDNDQESLQAQNDIQEAIAETKGGGTPTTPQTVVTNLGNKYGFKTTFTPDGKMVPTEESQWKRADLAGKLAMFGTALSCIVSALSGGNIPPINFNKIVGLDKQYTTYLANVHQYNEAISAGAKKSAENQADADYGMFLNSLPENERKIIENVSSDYEYTKSIADQERLKTQGKVNEDLINAQKQAGINAMLTLQQAVDEGKLSKEAFENWAKFHRADEGWGGIERFVNNLSTVGNTASQFVPKVGK